MLSSMASPQEKNEKIIDSIWFSRMAFWPTTTNDRRSNRWHVLFLKVTPHLHHTRSRVRSILEILNTHYYNKIAFSLLPVINTAHLIFLFHSLWIEIVLGITLCQTAITINPDITGLSILLIDIDLAILIIYPYRCFSTLLRSILRCACQTD